MKDQDKKGPANSINAYRRTDVITANRETILLMMYSGAIRFLKRAIEFQEAGDNAERNKWLLRVQDIVNELRSTLNFEVGGEMAHQLDGLYAYCTKLISEGMLENKLEALKEVTTILQTLNDGWEQAVEAQKKERVAKTAETNK